MSKPAGQVLVTGLRRIVELLGRRVVLRRRMPAKFGGGQLFVSPDSGLRYCRINIGNADPNLFRMAAELVRQGDVIWDIGANVGLFSFAAAGTAGPEGHVVALEPDTWLVGLLRRSSNLRAPERAPVVVIPAAVSDSIGLAKLHVSSRGRSYNFLEGSAAIRIGGTRSSDWVVTVTLDWLLQHLPTPGVLKIDVEGMEHRVLAGGLKLLAEERPRIWCEVTPKNADQVTRILHAANYDIYNGSLDPRQREPLPRAVWDTLALPKEEHRMAHPK